MRPLVVLLLVVLMFALLPMWPYSMAWGFGYFPSGLLGMILLIVLIMAFFGDRRGTRI